MAHKDKHRVHVQVEQLEDRWVPAGHITFNSSLGLIDIEGTPRSDKALVSYARNNTIRVNMWGGAHEVAFFQRNQVQQVVFNGNGGRDRVWNRTNIPLSIAAPSLHAQTSQRAASSAQGGDYTYLLSPAELLIFQQTNAYRASRGVPALLINPQLQQAAQNHANDMARVDRYGDTDQNGHILFGRTFVDRINATGYNWSEIGENVAYNFGYANPSQMLELQWWNSHEHQANMLDPTYREIGIGVASSASGRTYGVQDFGTHM